MSQTRRSFLQITLTVAGASYVAACGDDDASPGADASVPDAGDDTTRDAGDAGGSDAADGASDADADTGSLEPIESAEHFPQSLASGDPGSSSVIVWTRVVDAARGGDLALRLELATDESFANRLELDGNPALDLVAEAAFDGCVKVRIDGLEPATHYWYRFVYTDGANAWRTRHGRTRTAPAATDDRVVRFAFVSCQDYTGAFYNPYKRLVTEDIDLVVHLGDYIYETTGDPAFQERDSDRFVDFGDAAGALRLGEGEEVFFAARSLDNYRDLYRVYRSDPWLQRMHELFPFVMLWDDHEFSDDCWGANGTYLDDRASELDVERRKNANQAWFEYMPVDYLGDRAFRYERDAAFPGDLSIYRDLRYGANLHLLATDLRTWRPDHVIREDEHPWTIAVDAPTLEAHHGGVPDWAAPYVDLREQTELAAHVDAWATEATYPLEAVGPLVEAAWINALLAEAGEEELAQEVLDALPRGVSLRAAGKTSLYSSLGSRSLAVVRGYDLVSAERYRASEGASEDLMGSTQRAWFLDTMRSSDAAWKVWCNEFCLFAKVIDVSTYDRLPEALRQRFYLSVEDWGGAMNGRDALLAELADVAGAVAVTGDIHAFFASTPMVRSDASKRIPEFVTSSISSGTYERLLVKTANSDPGLREAGAAALALLVPDLLADRETRPNPDLAYARLNQHGYAVAEVDGTTFTVTLTGFPQNLAQQDLATEVARAADTVTIVRLQTRAGGRDLYRELDGVWRRWSIETMEWLDAE